MDTPHIVTGRALPPDEQNEERYSVVESPRDLPNWGRVTGLPLRSAILLLTVPVLYICLLGIAGNWPVDCGPAGCADSDLAGSAFGVGLFGAALMIYIGGAALFAFSRVRAGLALLAVATAIALYGIA